MKYICTECGDIFDEPHEYEESHGFTHGPYEKFSVCPYCGQPGYEECIECDKCGKPMAVSEANVVMIDGHEAKVCNKCYYEMEGE